MKPWARWTYVIAAIAAAVVTVSSIAQAIRQGSWAPIIAVGWLPAVVAATCWPGTRGRCWPRRQSTPGNRPRQRGPLTDPPRPAGLGS